MKKVRDFSKLSPSYDRYASIMLIADPAANPKEKLVARVRFAVELVGDMRAYNQKPTPTWPAYVRDEHEVRDAYDPPDSEHKQRVRRLWGRHRADVTEVEAENCSRLGALLYARDSLVMAGGAPAVTLVAELDRHLRAQFGIAPGEAPDKMIDRVRWVRAKTRDYRALPRGLRAL